MRIFPGARPARLLLAIAANLCVLSLSPVTVGDAQAQADLRQLSRDLAAPWAALQQPSGHITEPLQADGASRYGDAMVGLGILQTGIRERDGRLMNVGLGAITAATQTVDEWFATRPFEVWAVAAAYNLTKKRLGRAPAGRRALRRWARWLRQQRTTYLSRRGYNNKYLVDAVAVLEMQRTGLTSRRQGTVLGSGARLARKRAVRLVNRRIPAMASASQFVLSDPITNPPAYHALSYGFYARANELLGRDASSRSKKMLRAMGRVVAEIAAPDGDFAYWGRSMQQKWTLSTAAYGLARTAKISRSPAERAEYRGLAHRLITRLQSYGAGPRGEWLTPSLRQDFAAGRNSLDTYARATEYTGLALVTLNWANRLLEGRSALSEPTTHSAPQAIVGQGTGRFVTVRIGPLWYAVRQEGSGEQGVGDLRYDFGPVAVKRLESGRWRDLIPLRPRGSGSAGPVLLTARGPAFPAGESILASSDDGRVAIRGGFRYSDGSWARQGVDFTIKPSAERRCLVSSVAALAGDRYEFSAFLRGDVTPLVGPDSVASGAQRMQFNLPISAAPVQRGYSSASDARVTRQRVTVQAPVAQSVSATIC